MPDTDAEEHITVPFALAKRVRKLSSSAEFAPSSRAELLYLLWQEAEEEAFLRIVRLSERRDYSSTELLSKLKQDGFSEKARTSALERAQNARIVSDARFADVFIRSKISSGWGMRRIEQELARRGISTSEIAGWPYDYINPDDEFERAYELIARRPISGSNPTAKFVRYLVSRGYATSLAYAAVRKRIEDADFDEYDNS